MGPLLFTLYINDIGNTVNICNIHLYANDTVLYSCATSVQQAIRELQHDFDFNTEITYRFELELEKPRIKMELC